MAMTVTTPTRNDVQWLADRPRGEGTIGRCCADTSVAGGVRPVWREHPRGEVQQLEGSLPVDSRA